MVAKKRAKKNSRTYFTSETQEAIIKYTNSVDQHERNKLYRNEINFAFNKLAEILIHKGKFYYAGSSIDEIKSEVTLHLLEKLENYKASKGKAYSYFTVIVWRFLINLNNNNYQKIKMHVGESAFLDKETEKFITEEESDVDIAQFFDQLTEYLEENLVEIFPRKRDMNIANAVLIIMKRRHKIENFNKKAIYIYIREITDCKSSQITSIVGILKTIREKAWDDFIEKGYIPKNKMYV